MGLNLTVESFPYPYAADNHQEANARSLVEEGAAIMMKDREVTGEKLAAEIRALLDDQHKLTAMGEAMKRCARPNAAKVIVDECMKLLPRNIGTQEPRN